MLSKLKSISLSKWILIGMVSGALVGLFLNFYVTDPFIKDVVLLDNIFNLGGNGFIRLMKMLVVPLVFFSIVVGASSLSDIRKIGTIGGRTLLIYLITTALAISISLIIGMIIQPGVGLDLAGISQVNVTTNQTVTSTLLNIIPENPFYALSSGDMLPIIIFALLIGIILAELKGELETIDRLFSEANTIMMEMTRIVMYFAPIGVFCLIAKTFATLGIEGFLPLFKYVCCVMLALVVQLFIVYPSLLMIMTRLNPITFFKNFYSVMLFAFSSSSSNATIPLNLDKLSELGVSRDVSSFTIPLGATINMDGTAVMQGCAVMFAAQAYGMDLGMSALLTVIFTAVLASIGTAGVPSVGLITLNMVFNSIGLPVEAIGMIIGIDRVLDMFRSAVNVTGDAICTIIVSFKDKSLDLDLFKSK